MRKLAHIMPEKLFQYFEDLTQIPRGSGNMEQVSNYCLEFAKNHGLKAFRDEADNVVIYKNGSKGYENSVPVILQGHMDMVCQKEEGITIDFEQDGIDIYIDGDFIKARGTTLGADNGIAVAMALAILDDDTLEHPPIEAVFTVDEEIGMIGASKLDSSKLSGRKMLNLDSGEENVITVSCAGGIDVNLSYKMEKQKAFGKAVKISLSGLNGGHSGVEIHKGHTNSDILLGQILSDVQECEGFCLVSAKGGDKGNAIARFSEAVFMAKNVSGVVDDLQVKLEAVKTEIVEKEPAFSYEISLLDEAEYDVFPKEAEKGLIELLATVPNGVLAMSEDIDGLVESSCNFGILSEKDDGIYALISVRSNIMNEMKRITKDIMKQAEKCGFVASVSGIYPPWEFKKESALQEIYKREFASIMGYEPKVEAIHAGLECGIFTSGIDGLDCISVGPWLYDLHIPTERVSISSTKKIYDVVCAVLKACK